MFYMDELSHIVYQMLEFLPQRIKNAISNVNLNGLFELRLRAEKPVTMNFEGKYVFLGDSGRTNCEDKALIITLEEIADSIYKAGNYSVYSVEEQLKQGFITAKDGVRLGLAGEYVFEKGQPISLRNVTSLCIRIPHEIYGSGDKIYHSCMSDRIHSVLISSPPGLGKTTILRDLSRIVSQKTRLNVLLCDERGEISIGNIGKTCDVIKYADKKTAFETGIRAMRPDVIITDELSEADCAYLQKAVYAGIKIFASAHFSAMEYVKPPFYGLFERYVFLKDEIGNVSRIYDAEGKEYDD